MHRHQYTFDDIDDYYREDIPGLKGEHYYENLREVIIQAMVKQFDLLQQPTDVVLYYLKEFTALESTPHPEVVFRMLSSLEGKVDTQILFDHAWETITKNYEHLEKIKDIGDGELYNELYLSTNTLKKFLVQPRHPKG